MSVAPDPKPYSETQAEPHAAPMPFAPGYYRDPRLKSPIVAGLLSLMPGLGQAYLGFTRLAFIHATSAAFLMMLMASNRLGGAEPFFGTLLFFLWLFGLVDAHRRALLVNEAVLKMETPRLPDGLGQLSFGARLGFGLLFLAVGTLSLLSLRFGVSFAWLLDWWPVAFLAMGLWLIVKALRDRTSQA